MESVNLSPPLAKSELIFSFSLDRSDREDVSRHRTIAALARKPLFFSSSPTIVSSSISILFKFFFGRWIHISPKSTRDRRPSTSRAACRSTSRRACANAYAPALPVLCSSRTRSSLAKAERGIIGRKAVRLFPFLLIAVCCFRCSCSALSSLHRWYVVTSWSSRQPMFLIFSGAELVDTIMVRFQLA
jgi:hypothetical protein